MFSSNVIRILACVVSSIGESFADSEVNNVNSKIHARLANNPSFTVSLATIANIGVRARRYQRERIMNKIQRASSPGVQSLLLDPLSKYSLFRFCQGQNLY
jgi:hypothetical protein